MSTHETGFTMNRSDIEKAVTLFIANGGQIETLPDGPEDEIFLGESSDYTDEGFVDWRGGLGFDTPYVRNVTWDVHNLENANVRWYDDGC